MLETKDICDILGVKSNTVRKYALALESWGYVIKRDASNNREYTEVDATAFRELQALQKKTGLTVEKCAEVIANRHRDASDSVAPTVFQSENTQVTQHDGQHGQLLQMYNAMVEHNERQAAELERLHKRMDDQNANISVILREVLETRRMVAAAQQKKRWWQRKKTDEHEPDPESQWKRKQEIKEGNY